MLGPVGIPPTYYSDWLQRHAETRPNRLAISSPTTELTYAGFYRAVQGVANRLWECKIETGQTIGL